MMEYAPEQYSGDAQSWEGNMVGCTGPVEKTIEGIKIKEYTGPGEPSSVVKLKRERLGEAIKGLQSAGVMFKDDEVDEFKVVYYGNTNSGGINKESRGLVWFNSETAAKPTVLLQLGTRLEKHVIAQSRAGDPVTAGGTSMPPRVIADRFYDYYTTAKTISAKEKCSLAQIYHEFGHISHFLNSPTDFLMNADIAMGKTNKTQEHTARTALIDPAVALAERHISQYAGNRQLNEYVAEVFCGIMMGVAFDSINEEILNMYRTLGAAVPANPREPLKRHATFVSGQCQCKGSDNPETYGEKAKKQLY